MKVCEFGKQSGIFGTEKSFVRIDGDGIVLSSVTKADNGCVHVRIYNPTSHDTDGTVTFGFVVESAADVRLDGKVREALAVDGNAVKLRIGKGKIFTLEVK